MSAYYLDWNVVTAGEPSSTWIFFGILGLAIGVLIVRSVISRRVQKRTGVVPRRFRQAMLALCIATILGAVVTGWWLEKQSHYRQHQQADFLNRELGIRVHDPLQLTGFHSGSVTFDVDSPRGIGPCTLDSYFIDHHNELTSSKPSRGNGTGRLGMFVECPQPIPTDAARGQHRKPPP